MPVSDTETASPSKGRGSSIPVEKEWRDMLHAHWTEVKTGRHPKAFGETHNLIQFGEMLAKAVGRDEPFHESSIGRFLKGKQLSDEILEAFSIFFDLPSPLLAARHMEEIEWFHVGRMLRDNNRSEFQAILEKLKALVVADRKKADASRDVDNLLETNGQRPMLGTEHGNSSD